MNIRDFTGVTVIGGETTIRAPEPVPPGKLRIVATHLEMAAPPAFPAPPPPHNRRVALLRAERITVSFYRYLYNTVGEANFWYTRRAMPDDELKTIATHELVDVFVLHAGGVPAGFVELDRRSTPDIEIAFFGLVPEFIGQGFGRYLLGWAVAEAWRHAPRALKVSTNNLDHPRALPNYQKAGFVPVRQEIEIVDDPRLSGLIPRDVIPRG